MVLNLTRWSFKEESAISAYALQYTRLMEIIQALMIPVK